VLARHKGCFAVPAFDLRACTHARVHTRWHVHRLLSACHSNCTASTLLLPSKLGSSSSLKREMLTCSMMSFKLPSTLGRSPAASSPKFFSKGVRKARLHGPHNTLLMRVEPTQARLGTDVHMHTLSLVSCTCSKHVYMYIYTYCKFCSCAFIHTVSSVHVHLYIP